MSYSRYTNEAVQLLLGTKAKAAYAFVVDGDRGTGGCPVIEGLQAGSEYRRRCEELVRLLRRSADLLERDVNRQVPPMPVEKPSGDS